MSLFDRQLILVLGKGGVGRSTVSAAIALACAKRGRSTLLYSTSANDRFGGFFGQSAIGPEMMAVAPNLWAINTNPAAALEEYGLMILKFRRVYSMVFENRMSKFFLRAVPGLDDYAILGKVWFHVEELHRSGKGRRFDTVIFDMPASGHSLSMLRIPKVIVETVPDGPLKRDALSIQKLLSDDARTGVILTTLPEEMPVTEAKELTHSLQSELTMRPLRVVVNQVLPTRFLPGQSSTKVLDALLKSRAEGAMEGSANDRFLGQIAEHAELLRSRQNMQATYLREISMGLPFPKRELPFRFHGALTRRDIETFSELLAAQEAS